MNFRKLGFLAIVTLLLVAGCDDSKYRKAVRAADGISTSLSALQQAIEVSYRAGQLDRKGATITSQTIAQATLASDQLNFQLRTVKTLDAKSITAVAGYVNGIADSMDKLQQQGVLFFKSDLARIRFESSILAVKGSVVILQQLIAQETK